jgi:hypothetical protein
MQCRGQHHRPETGIQLNDWGELTMKTRNLLKALIGPSGLSLIPAGAGILRGNLDDIRHLKWPQ